ncbi:MAG TPA: hypothetical protein DEG17_18995 [Cyanobacteria bacterium UBA11149]|nr:hypothetical protein [Cyanobacteria bacterium UBA11367]HBE56210.1 hypothetical protein [Cyanobacteria bacterium UBA11366]HBK66006.1 hypothetical protein [Cyanobacteria bacterium UBA11166]HBR74722.1 hypothetical protein [Cyanobacteria bacterium UBA11159]HBS70322.1 hypothetical protein [Cyanobacteria bacterium UBA11153]HBW90898.1 hypothetical protein [Cyanobacteria bacterium UBA11149]HCA96748.1 hypothetical protein [Cyanobacteria bacterium UBA9226]
MKIISFLGCLASLAILGISPLLIILPPPVAAFTDENSVIGKVVLFDLFERVMGDFTLIGEGDYQIAPRVAKITLVESYAIVSWVWGDAGGQTVLVKENERWRVIMAGSGELKFSNLVQYNIPRDMARNLINRDKGALEKQPPVADLLVDSLPQIRGETDALILLPSELPMSKQPIYLINEVDGSSYRINLFLTRNCHTETRPSNSISHCGLGYFMANPIPPVYQPADMFTKEVALANSIRGYFTPSRCDAFLQANRGLCRAARIEWDWQGFNYKIELKGVGRDVGEEEAVMIAIANSAIIAGPR